tara:strand:- start:4020 stop:4202 length:183 start_codon:yes stop_codon:yes gene_type:complete
MRILPKNCHHDERFLLRAARWEAAREVVCVKCGLIQEAESARQLKHLYHQLLTNLGIVLS